MRVTYALLGCRILSVHSRWLAKFKCHLAARIGFIAVILSFACYCFAPKPVAAQGMVTEGEVIGIGKIGQFTFLIVQGDSFVDAFRAIIKTAPKTSLPILNLSVAQNRSFNALEALSAKDNTMQMAELSKLKIPKNSCTGAMRHLPTNDNFPMKCNVEFFKGPEAFIRLDLGDPRPKLEFSDSNGSFPTDIGQPHLPARATPPDNRLDNRATVVVPIVIAVSSGLVFKGGVHAISTSTAGHNAAADQSRTTSASAPLPPPSTAGESTSATTSLRP
jgi:hypothetical protein